MLGVKLGVLVLLCAQNSLYTLLRRYSRGVLREQVSTSAVLLAAEALKLVVSAALVEKPSYLDTSPHNGSSGRFGSRFATWAHVAKTSLPMAVPAITYLIMNTLSFKAMELIDATVFAMIAQLKTLTTALACWIVLGRRLSMAQWRAVLALTIAVSIITFQRSAAGSGSCNMTKSVGHGGQLEAQLEARSSHALISYMAGLSMVLLEITLSGWISAYFEKHLKNGGMSVWARNMQLAMWSVAIYSVMAVVQSAMAEEVVYKPIDQDSAPMPFLATPIIGNFSIVTCMVVLLGGGGGLLVAFAIKYADALMKTMATAAALVAVVAAEVLFLGAPPDPVVCLAGALAIVTLQIYGDAPKADAERPAPAKVMSSFPIGRPSTDMNDEEGKQLIRVVSEADPSP